MLARYAFACPASLVSPAVLSESHTGLPGSAPAAISAAVAVRQLVPCAYATLSVSNTNKKAMPARREIGIRNIVLVYPVRYLAHLMGYTGKENLIAMFMGVKSTKGLQIITRIHKDILHGVEKAQYEGVLRTHTS